MAGVAYNLGWVVLICGGVVFALIVLDWLASMVYSWARHQIADWQDTRRVLRASGLPRWNPRQAWSMSIKTSTYPPKE